MREFTNKEKELIINTPITIDCFDFNKHLPMPYSYINDESETDLENVYYHVELQRQLDVLADLLPSEKKRAEYLWKPVYDEYRRIDYRLRPFGLFD